MRYAQIKNFLFKFVSLYTRKLNNEALRKLIDCNRGIILPQYINITSIKKEEILNEHKNYIFFFMFLIPSQIKLFYCLVVFVLLLCFFKNEEENKIKIKKNILSVSHTHYHLTHPYLFDDADIIKKEGCAHPIHPQIFEFSIHTNAYEERERVLFGGDCRE